MSKSVTPIGLRLGINKYWTNRYFLFDYSAGFTRQMFIQRILYAKLKSINVKIINFQITRELSGLRVNTRVFVAPKDIREYISALLYRRFLKDYTVKYPTYSKSYIRKTAYRSAQKFCNLVQRYYFLVLLMITLDLERYLSKKLGLPVYIHMYNMYYLTEIPKVKLFNARLFRKFRHYSRRNPDFDLILRMLTVGFILLSPFLIGQVLVSRMEKVRKHSGLLGMFMNVLKIFISLKISNIFGLKIKISGKLNGRLRALNKVYIVGCAVPVQQLTSWVEYAFLEAFTYTGVFGIKFWAFCGTKTI